jgi:hypothetical protein
MLTPAFNHCFLFLEKSFVPPVGFMLCCKKKKKKKENRKDKTERDLSSRWERRAIQYERANARHKKLACDNGQHNA